MNRAGLESRLTSIWHDSAQPPFGLRLLALIFGAASAARRAAYRYRILPRRRVGVPVVVVGNITVGGSGKTPLTIWLARALAERGVKVGVVTRGYGGRARDWPRDVTPTSAAAEVGDEALLLARRTGCPVVAAPDRAKAAARLLDRHHVDIIVADDGLQHYALERDFEIAVVDGERGLGNGRLLPAGPLREPASRLAAVDCVVVKNLAAAGFDWPGAVGMTLAIGSARSLATGAVQPLASFAGAPVHAVAGIADPGQFFAALRAHGLDIIPHPFPDHAMLRLSDVNFGDDRPVLMTEKDAVKLTPAGAERLWAVAAEVKLPADAAEQLLTRIVELTAVS